jgi:hypothetical protein
MRGMSGTEAFPRKRYLRGRCGYSDSGPLTVCGT